MVDTFKLSDISDSNDDIDESVPSYHHKGYLTSPFFGYFLPFGASQLIPFFFKGFSSVIIPIF